MCEFYFKNELKREADEVTPKEIVKIMIRKLDELASALAIQTADLKEIKLILARMESTMNMKFDMVLGAIDELSAKIDNQQKEFATAHITNLRLAS